jgi:hypothetical protein
VSPRAFFLSLLVLPSLERLTPNHTATNSYASRAEELGQNSFSVPLQERSDSCGHQSKAFFAIAPAEDYYDGNRPIPKLVNNEQVAYQNIRSG